MKQENILFPIELIPRELDYKLLVSACLLKDNGSVIFCQHDLANKVMKRCQNGVYFGKNIINPKKYSIYKEFKRRNFLVIHLDEEGAIYPGPESILFSNLGMRVDINSLYEDDHVCTWGVTQEEFYKSKLKNKKGVQISTKGHVRFDLYRKPYRDIYQDEIKSIKDKYGPYILINTHFSYAINNSGMEDTFSERTGDGLSPEFTSRIVEEWAEETQKASHFVSLAHFLASNLKNINIILRPHPDEDKSFYRKAFKGVENITVTNEGPVGPWLLGSELLIHDRCTTAVEAFFSETPVINHRIITNENFDNRITNKIGSHSNSNEETLEIVNSILEDRNSFLSINELEKEQKDLIHNFSEDQVYNFTEFLQEVITNKDVAGKTRKPSLIWLYINELLYKLFLIIKLPIRYLFFPQKQKKYKASKAVFLGFNKKEIRKKANFLGNLLNKKFSIRFVSDRIFIITVDK